MQENMFLTSIHYFSAASVEVACKKNGGLYEFLEFEWFILA